jgi:hypothetical protein
MPARREVLAGIAALVGAGAGKGKPRARALAGDDFRHGLRQWAIEAEQPATVTARGGVLEIVAPAGVTLWFRRTLAGPIAVDYDLQAVSAGGPFDRVSDANCFWMARDPKAPGGDLLAAPRDGRFEAYDTLETYYVGLGGNTNSTTRFRRYVGRPGDRPLLPENDRRGREDMLVPNAWQHLRLTAEGERITFARDGRTLFDFHDPAPYREGRFGLRTTASHLRVRNFAISSLA